MLPLPQRTLLNVNVPAGKPSGVEVDEPRQAHLPRRAQARARGGRPAAAPALLDLWSDPGFHDEPGSDLAAVAAGRIAVTPLHFDLTHHPGLAALRDFDLQALLAPSAAQ